MEYLVQRHGNWYLGCYAAMGLCCFLLAAIVYRLYLNCCGRVLSAEFEDDDAAEDEAEESEEAPAEA